ncbi:hypothetical protein DFH06DRAFT_1464001 [Mycena polygramma]|nr:hypothetical protein DFH06DRAFT_1464001 [Mycena polygramma]
MASRLPTEICEIIVDELQDSRSLAFLCRTSPVFRCRAERILYHSVDLSCGTIHAVKWAHTVTRLPNCAQRVNTLALCLPDALIFDAEDARRSGAPSAAASI